jgi:hypothetical protein
MWIMLTFGRGSRAARGGPAMTMTFEQITAVLGPIDRETAASLAATGASVAELEEARAWLQSDEALVNHGRPMPKGKVAELIDILSPPQEDDQPS